jgi:hypothetical protein
MIPTLGWTVNPAETFQLFVELLTLCSDIIPTLGLAVNPAQTYFLFLVELLTQLRHSTYTRLSCLRFWDIVTAFSWVVKPVQTIPTVTAVVHPARTSFRHTHCTHLPTLMVGKRNVSYSWGSTTVLQCSWYTVSLTWIWLELDLVLCSSRLVPWTSRKSSALFKIITPLSLLAAVINSAGLPVPVEVLFLLRRLHKVLNTAFTRVICALFFLVWPLKNRGA